MPMHLRLAQGTRAKNPVTGPGWGRGCPHAVCLVGLAMSAKPSAPLAVPSAQYLLVPFVSRLLPLPFRSLSLAASLTPHLWVRRVTARALHTAGQHQGPQKHLHYFLNQKGKNEYSVGWVMFPFTPTQLQKRIFHIFMEEGPVKVILRPCS